VILLVDAGNTRIKWAVHAADGCIERGACPTPEAVNLDAAWATHPLQHALVSCVADRQARSRLREVLAVRVERTVWLQPAAAAHGLVSHYQPAESLGADRYAALVAAARRNLGACLVVGAGTALTVDALTADGQFLGGTISPGADLMYAALLQGTAGVRDISTAAMDIPARFAADFPVSTGAAVATGIALAQAGVVAAMRERLARHSGEAVTVLLAGGARALLSGLIAPPVLEADDLVLEGLAWIAKDEQWES